MGLLGSDFCYSGISLQISLVCCSNDEPKFDFNGNCNLDLEYAIGLTNPQTITLLQTGDLVEGRIMYLPGYVSGAGFDNWLDAVDGSFCTFEGGDDPTQDGIYPNPLSEGFKGSESCGIIAPSFVVSISYGQQEVTISAFSAMRQCTEYALGTAE
ncbi:hypothetical protein GYMLUDRAFT_82257 [Collybiopsis luxurians FD-317 M1]|nr:hypothetical protein GYMLUDRAFT_82257 [Collybiopsis luxurians FD-317 M1]